MAVKLETIKFAKAGKGHLHVSSMRSDIVDVIYVFFISSKTCDANQTFQESSGSTYMLPTD